VVDVSFVVFLLVVIVFFFVFWKLLNSKKNQSGAKIEIEYKTKKNHLNESVQNGVNWTYKFFAKNTI